MVPVLASTERAIHKKFEPVHPKYNTLPFRIGRQNWGGNLTLGMCKTYTNARFHLGVETTRKSWWRFYTPNSGELPLSLPYNLFSY